MSRYQQVEFNEDAAVALEVLPAPTTKPPAMVPRGPSTSKRRMPGYPAGYAPRPSPVHTALVLKQLLEGLRPARFHLYAQPIVSTDATFEGMYEILLRMEDADGNIVSPSEFVPIAEKHGLMPELDRWVLERTLITHGAAIKDIPRMQVSINLSGESLNDPHFLDFFLRCMRKSVVPAERVTLEITETAQVKDLVAARKILQQIRQLGCRIALDDFGMGSSLFSYLQSFPVDFLKIDGSIVRQVLECPVNLAIVRAAHQMARELGIRTITEFVESEPLLQKMRELGVDFTQGHAVGRPEPLVQVLQRLRRRLHGGRRIGGALNCWSLAP